MPEATDLDALDKELAPGQRVGEYVIEGKLGEGGFGTVYRASHPIIGKLVAIKVLNRQYSVQREMVSRFAAEARAVNQIRHRNIIDIFAFDQLEDGRRYYVMELLDGATLADHLARVPRMSLREALPILRAVGRALDAAHAKGIAHRDLKPENIFLASDPDGGYFPKLLDFGIAKLMGAEEAVAHKTRTGAPIGTPLYMSPEQCRGRDVDHRTDIYAFGIVAFRMLTGRVPFDGDNYMTILMQQMSDQPPPASSFVSDLPLEIDRAINWMLAKEPAARPTSLMQAVEALEHAAALVGVSSPTWNATPPVGGMVLPTGRPSEGFGLAATLASGQLTSAPTQAAVSASRHTTPDVVAPRPRRTGVWIGAALAMAAAGAIAFVALRGASSHSAGPTATGSAAVGNGAAAGSAATPGSGATTAGSGDTTAGSGDTAGSAAANGDGSAAAPQAVQLTFQGLPDDAVIYDAGHQALGLAKQGLRVPRSEQPIDLTFEMNGRVLAKQSVVPSSDQQLRVTVQEERPTGHAGERGNGRRRKPAPVNAGPAPDPANPDSTERPAGL